MSINTIINRFRIYIKLQNNQTDIQILGITSDENEYLISCKLDGRKTKIYFDKKYITCTGDEFIRMAYDEFKEMIENE